ncbi:hypothetical protein ACLK19_26615 [Escherichia coli]
MFNIPTLVGVDIDALTPWQHQTIYIDGNAGPLWLSQSCSSLLSARSPRTGRPA